MTPEPLEIQTIRKWEDRIDPRIAVARLRAGAVDALGGLPQLARPSGRAAYRMRPQRAPRVDMQLRLASDLSAAEYVAGQAWLDAAPPPCPFHPRAGCQFVGRGSFAE